MLSMPLESWQRCFSGRLAVKKAARTIYVPALFVKNFFIMVRSMPSNRSRTSEVSHFDSEIFSRATKISLPMRLCRRLQFPRRDTENVYHAATRFSASNASIPMKFAL
jgi:hypothetical protein